MDNDFKIGDVVALNSRDDNHIISGRVSSEPLMVIVEIFQSATDKRRYIDAQYFNAITGSYEVMLNIPVECFISVDSD